MLINCVAYKDGAKLADCPLDGISDYLTRPGCFVWVALKDATPEELSKMQEEFGLHELAIEDARHSHQRPKIEEYDDTLFAGGLGRHLRGGDCLRRHLGHELPEHARAEAALGLSGRARHHRGRVCVHVVDVPSRQVALKPAFA